jgi:hypothetical protein
VGNRQIEVVGRREDLSRAKEKGKGKVNENTI